MKHIPIFFTFDDNYAVPAAVAFFSLLNRAKNDVLYEMYVLHSDISEKSQQMLQGVVSRFSNGKLHFINTDGFLRNEWRNGNFEGHNNRSQFTADTIVRCFGARFFPQYDKIIYSDVDVVFMDDISDLWDIALNDRYVAGVKNAFMKYSTAELSHLKSEHYEMLKDSYIGGGIWVLNLEQIRKDNLESRIMSILRDDTIVKRWNDQDAINIACENKVVHIPLNYIAYPYMLDLLKEDDFKSHYTREELWDSIINPKIIHYAWLKPWKERVRYSGIWWTIYNYLNLPRTKIFENYDYEERLKKKVRRYKCRTRVLFLICIAMMSVLIYLILQH